MEDGGWLYKDTNPLLPSKDDYVIKYVQRDDICGQNTNWQHHQVQCTMVPLLTRSCLKANKLRPILNGQFCHAIFKNIGLNLFGSKQPREILVFVILKL